jgi:hypothetical protein
MQSPLLTILIRIGRNETEPYSKAVREVFLGGGPTGEDPSGTDQLLYCSEVREFVIEPTPTSDVQSQWPPKLKEILSSGNRQMIIILDAVEVLSRPGDVHTAAEANALQDAGSWSSTVVSVFLKNKGSLFPEDPSDSNVVRLGLEDLGERDLRLPFLKLYALHHALRLLTPPPGEGAEKPVRLFFSHAKRDGVPVTTAARDWMDRLKGFKSFYDTENLNLEGDIDDQLSKAVAEAVIIVFRTEIFDQRYWCQKEVLWAEQNNRPVTTVDARWQLQHGPSLIVFDTTPAVRIADGSFIRVFAAALREAVRIELFKQRVEIHTLSLQQGRKPKVVSIPRCPSLVSLHRAVRELRAEMQVDQEGLPQPPPAYVVYPNPSLPALLRTAAADLAKQSVPSCELLSLDEFRLKT